MSIFYCDQGIAVDKIILLNHFYEKLNCDVEPKIEKISNIIQKIVNLVNSLKTKRETLAIESDKDETSFSDLEFFDISFNKQISSLYNDTTKIIGEVKDGFLKLRQNFFSNDSPKFIKGSYILNRFDNVLSQSQITQQMKEVQIKVRALFLRFDLEYILVTSDNFYFSNNYNDLMKSLVSNMLKLLNFVIEEITPSENSLNSDFISISSKDQSKIIEIPLTKFA